MAVQIHAVSGIFQHKLFKTDVFASPVQQPHNQVSHLPAVPSAQSHINSLWPADWAHPSVWGREGRLSVLCLPGWEQQKHWEKCETTSTPGFNHEVTSHQPLIPTSFTVSAAKWVAEGDTHQSVVFVDIFFGEGLKVSTEQREKKRRRWSAGEKHCTSAASPGPPHNSWTLVMKETSGRIRKWKVHWRNNEIIRLCSEGICRVNRWNPVKIYSQEPLQELISHLRSAAKQDNRHLLKEHTLKISLKPQTIWSSGLEHNFTPASQNWSYRNTPHDAHSQSCWVLNHIHQSAPPEPRTGRSLRENVVLHF